MSLFPFSVLPSSTCSFCSILWSPVLFTLLWQPLKQIRELASLCEAPCVCETKRGATAGCELCVGFVFLCPPPKPVHRRKQFCVCCHRSFSQRGYYFFRADWTESLVYCLNAHACWSIHSCQLILPLSSESDPLHSRFLFHSFPFSSALLLSSLCVSVCVCCENVSTVRTAPLLRLRLVFRKIMEVLSAAQQRLDGVTAKLWPLGAWLRSSSQ